MRTRLTEGDLDRILTWSLVRVTRFAGQRMAERLSGHAMNPVHFGVLAVLAIRGEMTQAELARAVLVRPQSVAELVNGLEERGLLRRAGTRAKGRRNPIRITGQGRDALDAVWPIALASNDLTDVGLTPAESAELNRLLLKVMGTAEDRMRGVDEGWYAVPAAAARGIRTET